MGSGWPLGCDGRGAWRSLVSALVWGTRGPEFESRRPDRVSCGISPYWPVFRMGEYRLRHRRRLRRTNGEWAGDLQRARR